MPIEPVAKQLWPTLVEMADQVALQLSAAIAEGELADGRVDFPGWLASWHEQFCSWHDPVRLLVCQCVRGGKAAFLIDHLSLVDGFAFAHFTLSCVVAHQSQAHFATSLRNEPRPARLLPQWVAEACHDGRPAMSRAVTFLYARCQHFAPYATGAAPADPIGWEDVDQIYPAAPWLRSQTRVSKEASS